MRKLSLADLFMATTLVAVLILLWQGDVGGKRVSRVQSMLFSPDGQRIVFTSFSGAELTHGKSSLYRDMTKSIGYIECQPARVQMIRTDSFRETPSNKNPTSTYQPLSGFTLTPAVFLKNGMICWKGAQSRSIELFALDTHHRSSAEFPVKDFIVRLSASPTGKLLAVTARNGDLCVFEAATAKLLFKKEYRDLLLRSGAKIMSFSEDESKVLVSYKYPSVEILDIGTTKTSLCNLKNPLFQESLTGIQAAKAAELYRLRSVSFIENELLFTCSYFGVQIYDLSGNLVSTISNSEQVTMGCVSANGAKAAWVEGGRLVIYSLDQRVVIHQTPLASVTSLALSPDGELLAVGRTNSSGIAEIFGIDTQSGRTQVIATVPPFKRNSWLISAGSLVVWTLAYWGLKCSRCCAPSKTV